MFEKYENWNLNPDTQEAYMCTGWGGRDLQSCGAISWWPLGGVGG